ncbi:MAG: 4Fe-4S dicluster domain-containing protein [Nitrospirota bacterium]|jgi:heterodisulfide reductase subunit C
MANAAESSPGTVAYDPGFARDVFSRVKTADRVYLCMQCGVCSGSCPLTPLFPDFSPRVFIYLTQTGNLGELRRRAHLIDKCLGCYTCSQRCPRDVNPAEVVEALSHVVPKYFPEAVNKHEAAITQEYVDQIIGTGRLNLARLHVMSLLKTGRFLELLAPAEAKQGFKQFITGRMFKLMQLGSPRAWRSGLKGALTQIKERRAKEVAAA